MSTILAMSIFSIASDIPLFEAARRLTREKIIQLFLNDKDRGIAPDVLRLLRQEDLLERVRSGGEWEDGKQLYARANEDEAQWIPQGATANQVKAYHGAAKCVIVNFFVITDAIKSAMK